jgi:hypothetical protein
MELRLRHQHLDPTVPVSGDEEIFLTGLAQLPKNGIFVNWPRAAARL